jgi:hypothetical protein
VKFGVVVILFDVTLDDFKDMFGVSASEIALRQNGSCAGARKQ